MENKLILSVEIVLINVKENASAKTDSFSFFTRGQVNYVFSTIRLRQNSGALNVLAIF
jgi:hypothetical protein